MAGPRFDEASDARRQAQRRFVDHDPVQGGRQRLDAGVDPLELRIAFDLSPFDLPQVVGPRGRHVRQVGERLQLLPQPAQRGEPRQRRRMTPDLVQAGADPGAVRESGIIVRPGSIARADEFGIGRGERVALLTARFQRRESRLELRQDAAPCPEFVEAVRLEAQRHQRLAEVGQTGAGREQQLPEVAFAGQDSVAAGLQGLVVEREHGAVAGAVDAAELAADQGLGDRALGVVEEAALRPLDPHQLLAPAGEVQRTADLHGGVGVDEVVAAARLDAEQQIEEARESGRLAGLVGPIDDMQVGTAWFGGTEVDPPIGELAVAGQVETPKPHLRPVRPRSARGAGPGRPRRRPPRSAPARPRSSRHRCREPWPGIPWAVGRAVPRRWRPSRP